MRKICFSKVLSNDLLRQILDQLDTNQRRQAKEEMKERHLRSTYSLLFRYRLG